MSAGKHVHKIVVQVAPVLGAEKKRFDYTVIWIVGLGADRNWVVLEILRDRVLAEAE